MIHRMLLVPALALVGFMIGCSGSTPDTHEGREALQTGSETSLKEMSMADPGLSDFAKSAYGYVIFPEIGKGGFIVGGAYGKGTVYQGGQSIGWAELSQGSVGFLAGGQTFSELICFQNKAALERFKTNQLTFTANVSIVVVKAGASASANYDNGIAVFTMAKGGLMGDLSVGGQKFTYHSPDMMSSTTQP